MNKLAKAVLVGTLAITGLTGREARGAAVPSVIEQILPFSQFLGERLVTGPDGNNRFIWDYYGTSGPKLAGLGGSIVWIVDPTGNLVGVSPAIPSVGNRISKKIPTSSNIALHVSADNNTTLAFAYANPTGADFIPSFATWTLNAKGNLIAASGPVGFNGLQVLNMEFKQDYLVVTFAPSDQIYGGAIPLTGPFTVWVLDEFGHLVSAVGPQGPHQGFLLGAVTLSGPTGSPNQLWHWWGEAFPPLQFVLVAEEFDSSGNPLSQVNYGPY